MIDIKKNAANFFSTVFLAFSLIFTAGVLGHNYITQDAHADLEVCSTWNGVDDCQSAATNCYCEVVIKQ